MHEVRSRQGGPVALSAITEQLAQSITVTTNLHTEVVVTTKDKIANALYRVLPRYRRRTAWVAPATLLSSLIVALVSTDFSEKLWGLSPEMWQAMFYVATAGASLWLVWSMVGAAFRSASHDAVLKSIVATHAPDRSAPIPGHVVTDN
jgi:uncharacterized membrane protein